MLKVSPRPITTHRGPALLHECVPGQSCKDRCATMQRSCKQCLQAGPLAHRAVHLPSSTPFSSYPAAPLPRSQVMLPGQAQPQACRAQRASRPRMVCQPLQTRDSPRPEGSLRQVRGRACQQDRCHQVRSLPERHSLIYMSQSREEVWMQQGKP